MCLKVKDVQLRVSFKNTFKLNLNNIGLCDTLSVVLSILWHQLIPHKAYSSGIIILVLTKEIIHFLLWHYNQVWLCVGH
jgi:hypothetical protein